MCTLFLKNNILAQCNRIDWTTIHDQRSEITRADKTYQYTDVSCYDQAAYYRLQIAGASGRVSYSQVIKAIWQPGSFNIYPNPAADHLFIEQKEPVLSLQCLSIDGRDWPVRYQLTTYDLYKMDISFLLPGCYIFCINEKRKVF